MAQRGEAADAAVAAARQLAAAAGQASFNSPVTHVYNPLDYAWAAHETYLRAYATGPKRVLFLGMNPGPFGMAQTGVPFGEVAAVRDWMGIRAPIGRPPREHPKRPVLGFECARSEVSGRRLWGLFAQRFGDARIFFASHFVANYCPLALFDEAGRNLTPDKLPAGPLAGLSRACDAHLLRLARVLAVEWVIGVGDFAWKQAAAALEGRSIRVGKILHPSPASPAANRDWAGQATRQLKALGVWE